MVKVLINLILAVIFLFLFLRYMERKNVYFPLKEIEATPEDVALAYEDVMVKTKDGIQISGWFIPANSPKGVLLFCHGNGGNISHRLEKILIFNNLGLDIFIFDYRGYGRSKGQPSEKGLYLDTEAAYKYLTEIRKANPGKIVLFGESLGAAMAIDLAAKNDAAALIVEGAFTSAKAMGKRVYPLIPSFLYMISFDSLSKIKNIKSPKLFFHSKNDEIVPYQLARELFSAAPNAELIEIIGGHNTAFIELKHKVVPKIREFLERVLK